MSGEGQERFEDYLELERFIAELQAGRAAHPPQELTPDQARIYRMALLFHAATPGVGEPEAEFAGQLQARLEQALLEQPDEDQITDAPTQALPSVPPARPRKRPIPRRSLLTGGAIAAASALVGVGMEYMTEREMSRMSGVIQVTGAQVPTDWFPVMNVAELGDQAVKFISEQVVGYIVRYSGREGDPAERGQICAMLATCTHKGCIVQWSGSDRKYHCPCHGGVFNENGDIDRHTSSLYLDPLPRLDVKVENEKIYVRVPSSTSAVDTSPDA